MPGAIAPRPAHGTRLGQASFQVVVVDPKGTPYPGAQVQLQGQSAIPSLIPTDSSGVATFPISTAGTATVAVQVGGYTLKASGPTDRTLFVIVPVRAPEPILTGIEFVAIGVGGAAVIVGIKTKQKALQLFGELIAGACIFSSLYRANCH